MTIGLKYSSSILAQHTVLLASAGSRKALAMTQSLNAFEARVLGVTHDIINSENIKSLDLVHIGKNCDSYAN